MYIHTYTQTLVLQLSNFSIKSIFKYLKAILKNLEWGQKNLKNTENLRIAMPEYSKEKGLFET